MQEVWLYLHLHFSWIPHLGISVQEHPIHRKGEEREGVEEKGNIWQRCYMGFLFRGGYFGPFKGSVFKLRVLADAVIGKLLTVCWHGFRFISPKHKAPKIKRKSRQIPLPYVLKGSVCLLFWFSNVSKFSEITLEVIIKAPKKDIRDQWGTVLWGLAHLSIVCVNLGCTVSPVSAGLDSRFSPLTSRSIS